jgi:hypothetical protein
MFQFSLSDAGFFCRQMPAGLLIANAGCAFLMFSLFAFKPDFREVAFYITPAPAVFLFGAGFALISLMFRAAEDEASRQVVHVRYVKDIGRHQSKLKFLDGLADVSWWVSLIILVVGLAVTNMAMANLAHGKTETYAQRLAAEAEKAPLQSR